MPAVRVHWTQGRVDDEQLKQHRTFNSTQSIMKIALLTLLAGALPASAQTLSIDWFTIDGGGGTSTGSIFSLSGTIGQPDAGGPMTGGTFSLVGGFWALPFAVQSVDAPLLTIEPFGSGQARISWAPSTPGFVLQETTDLASGTWVNSPSGSANPVVVPATLPIKSYRLRKP
jgi:hypothetical protein